MQLKDLIIFDGRHNHRRALPSSYRFVPRKGLGTEMTSSMCALLLGTRFMQGIEPIGMDIGYAHWHMLLAGTGSVSHRQSTGHNDSWCAGHPAPLCFRENVSPKNIVDSGAFLNHCPRLRMLRATFRGLGSGLLEEELTTLEATMALRLTVSLLGIKLNVYNGGHTTDGFNFSHFSVLQQGSLHMSSSH